MQPISDLVQAHVRPLAFLLGEVQGGIEDRGPQITRGVLTVARSWGIALGHDYGTALTS